MSEIRVGISGWTYDAWHGLFYPKDLSREEELAYASSKLTSIEVNGTFYRLQTPETYQSWYQQTPEDFILSLKAPRFMTHVLRLQKCEEPLATFLASGPLCLKHKLGPILWQFPPNVTLKDDRFEKFAKLLPHTSNHAADLAKHHSKKIKDHAWTKAEGDFPIRHAFEFRHESFYRPDFVAMLKAHNIAVVFAHTGTPYFEDLTADFVYIRMHGIGPDFTKGYSTAAIHDMTRRAQVWQQGKQVRNPQCALPVSTQASEVALKPKDVFIYFDDEAKAHAPRDALRMIRTLEKNP